jgi:hypothetical protein
MRLLALIVGVVTGYALKIGIDRLRTPRPCFEEPLEFEEAPDHHAHLLFAMDHDPQEVEW